MGYRRSKGGCGSGWSEGLGVGVVQECRGPGGPGVVGDIGVMVGGLYNDFGCFI